MRGVMNDVVGTARRDGKGGKNAHERNATGAHSSVPTKPKSGMCSHQECRDCACGGNQARVRVEARAQRKGRQKKGKNASKKPRSAKLPPPPPPPAHPSPAAFSRDYTLGQRHRWCLIKTSFVGGCGRAQPGALLQCACRLPSDLLSHALPCTVATAPS